MTAASVSWTLFLPLVGCLASNKIQTIRRWSQSNLSPYWRGQSWPVTQGEWGPAQWAHRAPDGWTDGAAGLHFSSAGTAWGHGARGASGTGTEDDRPICQICLNQVFKKWGTHSKCDQICPRKKGGPEADPRSQCLLPASLQETEETESQKSQHLAEARRGLRLGVKGPF